MQWPKYFAYNNQNEHVGRNSKAYDTSICQKQQLMEIDVFIADICGYKNRIIWDDDTFY